LIQLLKSNKIDIAFVARSKTARPKGVGSVKKVDDLAGYSFGSHAAEREKPKGKLGHSSLAQANGWFLMR